MTRRRLAPKPAVRTLQTLLADSTGRLPLRRALRLARGVVKAVAASHAAGALLPGLSPASIELAGDGGVAVRAGSAALHAPELIAGRAPTVASDAYAVGAVLFQLFTGLTLAQARARSPVPRLHAVPAPSRFNPSLPDAVDALLPRLLAAHPEDRPASLRLVLAKLDEGLEELGLGAPPERTLLTAVPPQPARCAPAAAAEDAEDEADADEPEVSAPAKVEAAWLVAAVGFSAMALAVVLL